MAKDALAYEQNDSEAEKTYVKVIAAKEGNEENEGIVALVNVLKSDDIKKCINETYFSLTRLFYGFPGKNFPVSEKFS